MPFYRLILIKKRRVRKMFMRCSLVAMIWLILCETLRKHLLRIWQSPHTESFRFLNFVTYSKIEILITENLKNKFVTVKLGGHLNKIFQRGVIFCCHWMRNEGLSTFYHPGRLFDPRRKQFFVSIGLRRFSLCKW